jgi:hypothetical protein
LSDKIAAPLPEIPQSRKLKVYFSRACNILAFLIPALVAGQRPTILRIQIYTLGREPADKRIEKVSLATLQWVANEVRWRAGVQAEIFG